MEGLTGVIPESWRRVRKWKLRFPYERITRRVGKGRPVKVKTERMGKRSWRFKMSKIRIKFVSPICLLARLRDAYMRMMVNIEGKATMPGLPNAVPRPPPLRNLTPPPLRR